MAASEDLVSEVISPEVVPQIEATTAALVDATEQMVKASAAARQLGIDMANSTANNYKQLAQDENAVADATNEIVGAQKAYITTGNQVTQVMVQQGAAIRGNADEIKALRAELKQNEAIIRGNQEALNLMGAAAKNNQGMVQSLQAEIATLTARNEGLRSSIDNSTKSITQTVNVFGNLESTITRMGLRFVLYQTVFAAAAYVLTDVGKAITHTDDASKRATKNLQDYANKLRQIDESETSSAANQIAQAQVLFATASDLNLSMQARIESINKLQALYPNLLANESQEALLTGQAAKAMYELRDAILAKAAASGAEKKIGVLAANITELEAQKDADHQRSISLLGVGADPAMTPDGNPNAMRRNNKIEALKKQMDDLLTTAKNKTEEYQKILNKPHEGRWITDIQDDLKNTTQQLDHVAIGTEKYTGLLKKQKDLQKELREAEGKPEKKGPRGRTSIGAIGGTVSSEKTDDKVLADIQKQELQRDADNQQAIYENEVNSLDKRLAAYGKYTADKRRMLQIDADREIKQQQDVIEGIAAKRKELGTKITPAQNTEFNQQGKTATDTIELIKDTLDTKLNKVGLDVVKDVAAIAKSGIDIQFANIDEATAAKLVAIQQKVIQKTKEILNDASLSPSQRKSQIKTLGNDAATESDKVKENAKFGEIGALDAAFKASEIGEAEYKSKRAKLVEEITNLEKAAQDKQTANQEAADAKRIAGIKAIEDAAISAVQTAVSAEETIKNNQYQQELLNLNTKAATEQLYTSQELQNIQATTGYSIEKQQKLSAVNAQAQAQQNQIAAETRQVQQQQAIASRNAAIATAELNTAVAITRAFADYAMPYSLVVAGIVGAAGAFQIAAAESTPIPQFWKGTDYAPAGLALVGERGPELIKDRGGRFSITPGTPTLTNLSGGEKIFTAGVTQEIINAAMYGIVPQVKDVQPITIDLNKIADRIDYSNDRLANIMMRQRPVIIQGHSKSFDDYVIKSIK